VLVNHEYSGNSMTFTLRVRISHSTYNVVTRI